MLEETCPACKAPPNVNCDCSWDDIEAALQTKVSGPLSVLEAARAYVQANRAHEMLSPEWVAATQAAYKKLEEAVDATPAVPDGRRDCD